MSAKDDITTDISVENTPPVADTDTSTDDGTATASEVKEDVKADEQETTQEPSGLSDADVNLLDKLGNLTEEEALQKLETMDQSGRGRQADKMRELLNMRKEEPIVDDNKLQDLVNKELERRGITSDLLDTVQKSKQSQERDEVITRLGLNIGEVSKDEAFLKAFYSPDLKDKPVQDRTELAIARTYVGQREDPKKVEAAQNMTAPSKGDHRSESKDFASMSAREKSQYLQSLSSEDMVAQFG